MTTITTDYYAQAIDLSDAATVEAQLQALVQEKLDSVDALEAWLKRELEFSLKVREVLSGHTIDFYRDTGSEKKKQIHMYDQTVIQPLLLKYGAQLDKKFCECPYTKELDDGKYGQMKKARATGLELFREENIPLQVKEQELVASYNEIIGGLTAGWEREDRPYPYVVAQMDSPNRAVREAAWRSVQEARKSIKSKVAAMMDELVALRHQIAVNAGFENYRDYVFREKNREYTVEDCYNFHNAVERYVVPAWDRLARQLQGVLGVDAYRPWDVTPCTLSGAPFETVDQLMDGVEKMLYATDTYFGDKFKHMRERGLLDLDSRSGKAPGGFCDFLGYSNNTFVFANFSPSFFALIALLHEMGHAVNGYLQVRDEYEWADLRPEVAELYSHGMELLCLDKLGEFYRDESSLKNAQREELHRSLNMLIGPLSGDLFQHWLYTNPHHTAEERDAKYFEILKRFSGHPVDYSGLEAEASSAWIDSIHFIAYPFYNIEYAMSELGALQLLETYRRDRSEAIANYKRGASTDFNQPIAKIYEDTGVHFDFSDAAVLRVAKFTEHIIESLG
ncbi:M3 family oligoendopeptidase [Alicyclobacillus fastidiosus]|uniref:M3 family oligoendopeptidase n=2 Tax=Alicyclobacillus fastidiosus TaxID=392011 RepID=A0ABY6ZIJ1_9BACL|nr:M3 family oligoendopeptidase [Alicyclobacillus fastidiosus]WAH42739.1 M3 family oligoendopeptidase [Alicyclobacillus fastidiosus]